MYDFEIGKEKVAVIKFLEPVDLGSMTGVHLDKVVRITPGEVCLYPSDEWPDRPAAGEGLNVTAQVTLYGIWPKKHLEGQVLKGTKLVNFTKRLQEVAHCTFVDYDGQQGIWKFEVKRGDWHA